MDLFKLLVIATFISFVIGWFSGSAARSSTTDQDQPDQPDKPDLPDKADRRLHLWVGAIVLGAGMPTAMAVLVFLFATCDSFFITCNLIAGTVSVLVGLTAGYFLTVPS